MEKRLDKLDEKLDKVLDKIEEINVTLAKNTSDLEYHILRTNQNEEMISELREEIKPLTKLQTKIEAIFSLVGKLSTGAGIIAGIVKAYYELKK